MNRTILALIFSITILRAEGDLQVRGEFNPRFLLDWDREFIGIPYRLLRLDVNSSHEDVSGTIALDFEYRPRTNSVDLNLQEAYVMYNHGPGEFSVGKQIVVWGSADGNNPTDNVNPYNYYYMFLAGADRKIGKIMIREELYYQDFTLSLVASPFFAPDRLPINDPDLPLFSPPFDIFDSLIGTPETSLENSEFGARLHLGMPVGEVALSYFDAYDRKFLPEITMQMSPVPTLRVDRLTYYRNRVLGMETVGLWRDFALRMEGAYFFTEDLDGDKPFVRNNYVQYVGQVDWNAPGRTMLILQYLGMTSLGKEDDMDFIDKMPPGMGAVFCGFARSAVMAVAKKDLGDAPHKLEARALYDFDMEGYMLGGSIDLSPADAFYITLGINYFDGPSGSMFNALHHFSHLLLAGKYSF
ncbi:hypothetical protein ACFL5V_12280 [Fibrobacterota bacterium]